MDDRHLYSTALVGAPWLEVLGGAALAGCGVLLCGEPGQVAAGGAALAASSLAGTLAWRQLWMRSMPAQD